MKYGRTYNFSAGPAMMPEEVLEEIAAEMMNYRGSGMCVMEMSHRSKVFQQIRDEAEADLRQLMGIPDNYKVLFVQGGGTVQFAMVPMNLMKNGVACYVETGNWSKKAIKEAQKYGEVKIVASSADKNFSYIPDCSDLDIPDNADYVYICENETINGTTYFHLPNTKGKIDLPKRGRSDGAGGDFPGAVQRPQVLRVGGRRESLLPAVVAAVGKAEAIGVEFHPPDLPAPAVQFRVDEPGLVLFLKILFDQHVGHSIPSLRKKS